MRHNPNARWEGWVGKYNHVAYVIITDFPLQIDDYKNDQRNFGMNLEKPP